MRNLGESAHLFENGIKALVCQRRTLNIFRGSKGVCEALSLLLGDLQLVSAGQLPTDLSVVSSQIDLGRDDEKGYVRAKVAYFWNPLVPDVLE